MTQSQGNALEPFARELLDALDAHIAVLDARGIVVAVNEAWRRFARENRALTDTCGLGSSYLAVCEAGAAAGEQTAAAMHRGLRALLAGEGERFSIEYPCHSPQARRWFLARVTRFGHGGAAYVAVVHEDITTRMLAEEERVVAQAELTRAKRSVDAVNIELRAVLEREREKARTDELTGLCNRRHFFELAAQQAAVARRYRSPFSILMLDLDHFKRVNDRFGHQYGDAILRCVARIAREHVRAADVLARYGGEEFIVALPLTQAEEALAAAEKLRENVAAQCADIGGREARITISVGVAQMAGVEETLEDVIRRADEALYQAKHEGRNRSKVALPVR